MTYIGSHAARRRPGCAWLAVAPVAAAGAIAMFFASQPAVAEKAPVGLGTAASFAVLAGTTVTNTGPTRPAPTPTSTTSTTPAPTSTATTRRLLLHPSVPLSR
jgi:hypothetical protein